MNCHTCKILTLLKYIHIFIPTIIFYTLFYTFILVYRWYVNASSFDTLHSVYYALINNFPGKSNSTQDQQLITADFSKQVTSSTPVTVSLVPISSSNTIMLQFIAYSHKQNKLYFAGPSKYVPNQAYVGYICPKTGVVKQVMVERSDIVSIGPLIVNDNNHELLVYMKSSTSISNEWRLLSIDYYTSKVTEVKYYEGDAYRSFAAGVNV